MAATLQPKAATLQRKAATLQRKVATHQQQAASLQQQEVTPNREADTQTRPVVVTLPQQAVIPQLPGASLPRPVVTLPKLEASLLKQEDTSSLSLEQEAIPPCLQQVVEAGVQHQVAMERQVVLSRDTKGVPLRASPCQVTQEPPPTHKCRHMEVELRPTLRHLPFIKGTGVL